MNHFQKNNQWRPRQPHQRQQNQGQSRPQSPARPAAFLAGTAVDPAPRIVLEKGSKELTMRAMDLIAPIGMGQRGLIVAPPGSGKTTLLKHLCQAVAVSAPDIKLYALLVDERPEEVTDFKRGVTAEVWSSSSDESYEHHIQMADQLMHKAMTEAGEGKNVMIVIDSLTRLSRVHNAEQRGGGKIMSGGVGAGALEIPRRIFGSARKIENGGSLTIIATILVDTGSRMDEVIFEEFKGTGNMELVLSREVSQQRIFPAIDINKSGTRKEELLLSPEDLAKIHKLRGILANLEIVDAARTLVETLQSYPSNEKLLAAV